MADAAAILAAAVGDIGGQSRPGQETMAAAVAEAFTSGVHLLVQAGTGTGKSLGYLAPALARCLETDDRVIVATATLALQAQLANKDIPTALEAGGAAALTVTLTLPISYEACTEDLGAWTHTFTLPDEVTGRPIVVTITGEDLSGFIAGDVGLQDVILELP